MHLAWTDSKVPLYMAGSSISFSWALVMSDKVGTLRYKWHQLMCLIWVGFHVLLAKTKVLVIGTLGSGNAWVVHSELTLNFHQVDPEGL